MLTHHRFVATLGLLLTSLSSLATAAEPPQSRTVQEPSARVIAFHGYTKAIELSRGNARVVLCAQVGGRVLEFSVDGQNALYLNEAEKAWKPGQPAQSSAGRFDYGPELTVIPHPELWGGEWVGEITGNCSARLTSPRDTAAGIQLVRDFQLTTSAKGGWDGPFHLVCTQTIRNIGEEVREVCHWGRSFSPGGGNLHHPAR